MQMDKSMKGLRDDFKVIVSRGEVFDGLKNQISTFCICEDEV